MIANAPNESLADGRAYDICVIGSGPAGISLAMALEAKGLSVLLLEAGADSYDEQSQAMFDGDIIGTPLFNMGVNRLRYFGGASNHWGGFCRHLDEWDFRQKVAGVDTAWPITRGDLEPYLDRARDILEIACIGENEALNDQLIQVRWTYSPPVQFASKYRDAIKRSTRLTLSLNSYVTNFVSKDGAVVALDVRDAANNRYTVRAKQYVLCAGGIENSRMLLWANTQNEARLIPQADALGKYWMEHPHYTVGEAVVGSKVPLEIDRKGRAYIAPSERAIKEKGILNCALRFEPAEYEGAKKMVGDLACAVPGLGHRALKLFDKNLVCGARLRAAWEQAPMASNQVRLSSKRDSAGVPRAELHWRKSELDLRTIRETVLMFGEYLVGKDLGRVRVLPWVMGRGDYPEDDEHIGNHHMGGTRMSSDPKTGVVDANCKSAVHRCFRAPGTPIRR
jgi:choline dehydrogenase-like flavoprotein